MRKIIFAGFLLFINSQLFSQVTQFLSMGFNAFNDPVFGKPIYYFYGYDDYSEAMINHLGVLLLSTDEVGHYVPSPIRPALEEKYKRYNGQNGSIGYSAFLGATDDQGLEYILKNGKLTYWALTMNFRPYTIVNKIEQTDTKITIYTTINHNGFGPTGERKYEYYNIPERELLDRYLTLYVEAICAIVNKEDIIGTYKFFDNSKGSGIRRLLAGRTKRELAIFRNCLFAMKGLKFQTQAWTDFFNKYLNGYNARYSNDEIMKMLTEEEKWLLDLIIQYENSR